MTTALTKIRSRACVLAQSVSSIYVPLNGLESIEVSGEKLQTQKTTTLDGGRTDTYDPNGYADAPTIKASGFYNPSDPTYTNAASLITGVNTSPSSMPCNFKLTYTDSAPTSAVYAAASIGIDKKIEAASMVKADINIQTTGDPS